MNITPKGEYGYCGVLMRWRERNEHYGYPPPRYNASMPAFRLRAKLISSETAHGLDTLARAWDAHAAFMREHYDAKFLADTYHGEYDA